MSVTLYHPSIENGSVGKGGCRHPVVDHLVEVCDKDEKHFRKLGLVDVPKGRKGSHGKNSTPVPVVVASAVPAPTVTSPPEEATEEPGGSKEDED